MSELTISNISPPFGYQRSFEPIKRAMGSLYALGVLAMISFFFIAAAGHLRSFPLHLSWKQMAAGAGGFVVLTSGGVIVLHHAKKKEHPILKIPFGTFRASHLKEGSSNLEGSCYPVYIDTSTLINGSGKAYLYGVKSLKEHYTVTAAVLLSTPLYTVGRMIYHLFRFVISPFYYGLQGKLKEIPKEMGASFRKIVEAPFYGVALFFAALYALVDPIGGRKLGTKVELAWNDGLSRAESFWSVRGRQRLFKWSKSGVYLAGCWAPVGVAYYQNGELLGAKTLSKAIEADLAK